MKLFVGLGNPGRQYQDNRHNIGFMAMDEIFHRHKFSGWSDKFKGELASGTLAGEKVLLLKPQTFMNLSGQSVQAAAAFYKIALDDILVFHDELDIAPGKIRIKKGGGAGGHNGIRSIDEHLGPEYWRVRLGIGHPGDKDMVSPYVLGNFSGEDKKWLEPYIAALAEFADIAAKGDKDGYMTKVAQKLQPPRENKKIENKKQEDKKKEEKDGI